ncbi:hypothetical protein L484_002909 [Morus notabilis]|uniref:S-protein homolog n=1 Tax=Morus notabilis TaxID=981085 RepID=W9QVK6_9ROSA|nr:hypothetical protein L484_002909 [Morus notabilis]
MKITKSFPTLFLWLLLFTASSRGGAGQYGDIMRRTVRVENDLGGGIRLNVHCRSEDDDLGVRDLGNGQNIQWSFRNNWLGTTLFWCSMKWNNVGGSFDVYSFKRDFDLCGFKCWWSIRRDGAYFYSEFKNVWEKRYVWKKVKF